MIVIVPYDPAWAEQYAEEALKVREALRELVVRIDHVGSTSVPGLAAKPVIDIQLSVGSLQPLWPIKVLLGKVGYTHVPDPDEEFERVYPSFRKPLNWPSTHHLHACTAGSEQERSHIAFRDYLRDHAETAAEYLDLKLRLATSYEGTATESRERYARSKTSFVESVLKRAYESEYPKA